MNSPQSLWQFINEFSFKCRAHAYVVKHADLSDEMTVDAEVNRVEK